MFIGGASPGGASELLEALEGGEDARVLALLEGGVDPNTRGEDGDTPLIAAVGVGRPSLVARLLEAGADPNAADDEGNSPLDYALMRRDPEIARLLLAAGADATSPSSAIAAAAHAPASIVEAILDRGGDPNARDASGRTPLLAACAAGRVETAALLLARGADPRARDEDGTTTLLALLEGLARDALMDDVALLRSRAHSLDGLRSIVRELVARREVEPHAVTVPPAFRDVFTALLDGGARVDAVDELGRNALAIAVCEGYPPWVVDALLARGADPHKPDEDGLTAADFAETHPSDEVRAMLRG